MSEVKMSDDNGIEYDEVDMGEVGKIADVTVDDVDVSRAGISDFIDAIANKNFTSAEKQFGDMVDDRMQAALDQAKIDVANRIYNDQTEIKDDEDEDAVED
jgi:hypothetical protein